MYLFSLSGITPKIEMSLEDGKHLVNTYVVTYENINPNGDFYLDQSPMVTDDEYVHFEFEFSPLPLHVVVCAQPPPGATLEDYVNAETPVTVSLSFGNTYYLDELWYPEINTTMSIIKNQWPAIWNGYVKHQRLVS